jgi:hypothetical protein
MSFIYYQTEKVDTWTCIDEGSAKAASALKWFLHHDAHQVVWPSITFHETVAELAKSGWHEHVKPFPYFMNTDLLQTATKRHIEKFCGPFVTFGAKQHLFKMNRKIESDADYVRLFDDMLLNQDSIFLSGQFKIGELCKDQSGKRYSMFVTTGYCNRKVIDLVSEKVITVGDGSHFDIDLSQSGRASNILEDFFSK